MRLNIKFCNECYNVSDHDVCDICKQPSRRGSSMCVVESSREVLAIESTQQYNGLYHVLGGLISPLDGVGPEDLKIKESDKALSVPYGGSLQKTEIAWHEYLGTLWAKLREQID